MREPKYHIYLTGEEYHQILETLIEEKNALIRLGKYTDLIDELLFKVACAKKKKIRVKI